MKLKPPAAAFGKSMPETQPRSSASKANLQGVRYTMLTCLLVGASFIAACYVPPGAPNAPQSSVSESASTHFAEPLKEVVITLEIQTPSPAWTLSPVALHLDPEGNYLAIHKLERSDAMAAQVISSVGDRFQFEHEGNAPAKVKHYVFGKTWNWDSNPEVTFIETLDEIKDALAGSQSVPFTSD